VRNSCETVEIRFDFMRSLKVFRPLGPIAWRPLFWLMKRTVRGWTVPCHRLRAELGLPPTTADPLFEGQHSPHLGLAMFSPVLGTKQRDWPASTLVSGFALYDRHDEHTVLSPELAKFLDAGEAPVVFTLGSSAVMDAGPFYDYAAQAAAQLGRRAVLLIGKDERNRLASLPAGVMACEYAPYSDLFPRAAVIVHQGGVGTTAQALRSGRPMLVMPYAHDQPDNAERCAAAGVGIVVGPDQRDAASVRAAAERVLGDGTFGDAARRAQAEIAGMPEPASVLRELERLVAARS
jgi:UDP:flavonoid glycosyltransferase YjiC (YdhE family)